METIRYNGEEVHISLEYNKTVIRMYDSDFCPLDTLHHKTLEPLKEGEICVKPEYLNFLVENGIVSPPHRITKIGEEVQICKLKP